MLSAVVSQHVMLQPSFSASFCQTHSTQSSSTVHTGSATPPPPPCPPFQAPPPPLLAYPPPPSPLMPFSWFPAPPPALAPSGKPPDPPGPEELVEPAPSLGFNLLRSIVPPQPTSSNIPSTIAPLNRLFSFMFMGGRRCGERAAPNASAL